MPKFWKFSLDTTSVIDNDDLAIFMLFSHHNCIVVVEYSTFFEGWLYQHLAIFGNEPPCLRSTTFVPVVN